MQLVIFLAFASLMFGDLFFAGLFALIALTFEQPSAEH